MRLLRLFAPPFFLRCKGDAPPKSLFAVLDGKTFLERGCS
ncbi:hypothetical protein TO73_0824 [Thermus aquaticus Y51MC23]|uniref:Uncharacterized protein n=1 Tax=Thermus aquaticus (strain ATCC BAA-2747 / Y51MC23) TaxID=498848 RepID=A0ABN4II60_THEA5|nr:hypothetical protein TO73_0824 [Thermus aquaticus Y51MC23]